MTVRAMIVLLLLALATAPAAQQLPGRDGESFTPTIGTASLSGVVVNDEMRPQPVRRAIVTLAGSGLRPSRGTVTDDDGRFTFRNLPGGRLTLTVTRATYITSVYGAKRPGRPGTAIVVADGADVTGLTVKLWRGAVVAGVVRDATGAPLPGIRVTAVPAKPAGTGALASLSNNGAPTNELGEFRIFGLEPGAHVVAAQPSSGGSQMIALRDQDVDAIFESLKRRSTADAGRPAPSAAQPEKFDLAPVYYPNALSPGQAAQLDLTAGKETSGLDITIQRVPTAAISGRVMRPDGTPAAGAAVQLTANLPAGSFGAIQSPPLDTRTREDGSFQLAQVVPGSYRLIARASAGSPPPPTPGLVMPGPVGPQLWASTNVSVSGGESGGISLTLEPGFTVRGQVVFRGASKPPAMAGLRVNILPASVVNQQPGTVISTIAFVPGVVVNPDGTFEIQNLPPGLSRVVIAGGALASGQWFLQSAVMGERDMLEGDFEISGGGSATMTVTITDRSTELSGVLQSASGAPASDVFVLAFSVNRAFWIPGTRRTQAVRPDVDGRYTIKGLPPGDYLVAALTDADENDWNDSRLLEQLVPASIRISLGDGERKVQDLRIGGVLRPR